MIDDTGMIDSQDNNPLEDPVLDPETSAIVGSDFVVDGFPFEEIFDMELMSLLPFDSENDVPHPSHIEHFSTSAPR